MMKKLLLGLLLIILLAPTLGCLNNTEMKIEKGRNAISEEASPTTASEPKKTSNTTNDPEVAKVISQLQNDKFLNSQTLDPAKFEVLTQGLLEGWNDFRIEDKTYEKLKATKLEDTLGRIFDWKYITKQIAPQYVKLLNLHISSVKDKNSVLKKFADSGLILFNENGIYEIIIPESTNFESDFGNVTTNLQKDEVYRRLKDRWVLWKGKITDVTDHSVSFKNIKSSSFIMDVMITNIKMQKDELLLYNSGDIVWYAGKLVMMEGTITPWTLTDGQIVAVISRN